MREFSDFEKDVLKQLVQPENPPHKTVGYPFSAVIDKAFLEFCCTFFRNDRTKQIEYDIYYLQASDRQKEDALLFFELFEDTENILKIISFVNKNFVSLMLLLQYMESLYYIKFHKLEQRSLYGEKKYTLEQVFDYRRKFFSEECKIFLNNRELIVLNSLKVDKKSLKIDDKIVNNFYYNHWNDDIYVTNALRALVENNFKTDDQIRVEAQLANAENQLVEAKRQTKNSKKTMWISVGTVIVAILTLIASIIVPIIINSKP